MDRADFGTIAEFRGAEDPPAAIQEAAKSTVPTLGYGMAYAVGIVGTIIVGLPA